LSAMMLHPDRKANLKWQGDFTLPRFRAKLANRYLLHPGLAPGYEEQYRSDLGDRTIARKEYSTSYDFSASSSTKILTPLGGTNTQLGDSRGSTLTQWGRSSKSSLGAAGSSSLGRSSSVPVIGLRRMEAQPAAARLAKTASSSSLAKTQERMPTSPTSADDKKEKEKEMAMEAACRRLWAAAHGCELNIKEFIDLRVDDPSMQLKTCPVPGITKSLKQGAKLDWRNPEWDGATLFLKAVRTDAIGLAEYLLSVGGSAGATNVDPLVLDNSGRGAFHWAAMGGNPAMMEFLLKAPNITNVSGWESHIQAPDNGGDTPIHLASYYGHLSIVRLLTHAKVDPHQENDGGYSASDLSEARKMWHIGHYLSEKKQQKEDIETDKFEVRNLVRPCNLARANELRDIAALNPKPKPKAAAKAKKK